jgi:6-phosphogluconolactonase
VFSIHRRVMLRSRQMARRAYIGTYADAIYSCRSFETPALVATTPRPSFVAIHPNRTVLYAVSEVSDGSVSAWKIDSDTGALTFIGRQSSGGAGPCHVAVEPAGAFVLVANYAGGSVAAIGIRSDGGLADLLVTHPHSGAGILPRQSEPHPHGCFFSPDGQLVVVPDLGADRIFFYRLGQSFEPAGPPSVAVPAGSGPRHFAFHPSGRFGYAVCELNSTIAAFQFGPRSTEPFATVSALPPAYDGENIAAGICADATGRFLYCSNRGADTVGVFAIDASGELAPVQHIVAGGRTPRHVALDPSGQWLVSANQDSDAVNVFPRDAATGRLEAPARCLAVPKPACITFV